jgi:hypothetical protein
MDVVVQHQIKDPQPAFSRGEKLIKAEGAPAGVRGLQFYPSADGSAVTCLWEADSSRRSRSTSTRRSGTPARTRATRSTRSRRSRSGPLGLPASAPIGAQIQ